MISSTPVSVLQSLTVSGQTGTLASKASMTSLLLRTCHFTKDELNSIDSMTGIKEKLVRKLILDSNNVSVKYSKFHGN